MRSLELRQLELEAPRDDLEAEVEEVRGASPRGRAARARPTSRVVGRDQAGEVDVEVRLQRRVLEEVRHHQLGIGVRLELQHDPHVVGRLVAHVDQLRQLPLDDHSPIFSTSVDLFSAYGIEVMTICCLPPVRLLDLPLAAQPDRALPRLVDLAQLLLAC